MLEEAGTSKPTSSSSKNDKTEITTNKHFSSTSTSCSPSNNTNVKNDTAHIKTCTTSPSSPAKPEQHESAATLTSKKVSKQTCRHAEHRNAQTSKEEATQEKKLVTLEEEGASNTKLQQKQQQHTATSNTSSVDTQLDLINTLKRITSWIDVYL